MAKSLTNEDKYIFNTSSLDIVYDRELMIQNVTFGRDF
jgi:hypothetical protein